MPEPFDDLLAAALDDDVRALADQAETTGRFPKELVQLIAERGVYAAKWGSDTRPDVAKVVAFALRLGAMGSLAVAAGAGVQDSCLAILRRFGTTDFSKALADSGIRGESVFCIAGTESEGGSDLAHAESTCRRDGDGYRLTGHKKFVTLAPIADVALVSVRDGDTSAASPRAAVFAVPTSRLDIGEPHSLVGNACLNTSPLRFDTWVPAEAMIARPGLGLAAMNWGLAHERLSIACHVVATCEAAIGLTAARLHRRRQFGSTLFEHQALRLRLADLQARVHVVRLALLGVGATDQGFDLRTAAALKVSAARLGEEVLSECMHMFGGVGYLSEQSPIGRWWRDMKLARVAAGVDEVLWELVAVSIVADDGAYDRLMAEKD
ncbi:acyl-CoA dehydrogenase family protein [Nocardia sp. NPDC002869]|uniref:acyl-CoA dehydrogenase family protein n=1 Tax=Nocardia sp. NPDC002869 TaxID=3161032 RepID=UPI00398C947D